RLVHDGIVVRLPGPSAPRRTGPRGAREPLKSRYREPRDVSVSNQRRKRRRGGAPAAQSAQEATGPRTATTLGSANTTPTTSAETSARPPPPLAHSALQRVMRCSWRMPGTVPRLGVGSHWPKGVEHALTPVGKDEGRVSPPLARDCVLVAT